jgi:VIT1/CCC1 family predicted Fe2+/Mn2+ transporter
VTFLFGSVLGIVLLLIFAPSWFFAPLTLTVMGVALLVSGEMPKSRSNSEYIDAEVIDYDKR